MMPAEMLSNTGMTLSLLLKSAPFGYTLSQIKKQLASLPDNRTPTKSDWDRFLVA